MNFLSRSMLACAALMIAAPLAVADPSANPAGWSTAAPRDEIEPQFAYQAHGGIDGHGALVIRADHREGLDGYWTKTFPVIGGRHFRFEAFYRAAGVAVPRRSVVPRLLWQDAAGRPVPSDEPVVAGYLISKS